MSNEELNAAREAFRDQVDNAGPMNDIVDPAYQEPAHNDVVESQEYDGPVEDQGAEQGTAETVVTEAEQQAQAEEKKPRLAPVKGVVKVGRQLVAEGFSDEAVLASLQKMYTDAGRDEKNAKSSAQVVLHDIKNRQLKEKTA